MHTIPQGPKGYPLIGSIANLASANRLNWLQAISDRYGDVTHFNLLKRQVYLVNHPDLVQQMLTRGSQNYSKKTIGFKMVDDQLKSALTEQGLEAIVPDGKRFDPNLHECISQQASDEIEEDCVIQTVRSGYRLNEKLLRAANVIVSSGPAKAE